MNSQLCALWNVEEGIQQEDWEERYAAQLFDARKELRSLIQIPKLFDKKWSLYHQWAEIENGLPIPSDPMKEGDFSVHAYEERLAVALLAMEKAGNFIHLSNACEQISILQKAYAEWVIATVKNWEEDWENIEVNSRSYFPMGKYLRSLKQGMTNENWRSELLKERKRISIVY
jgi:hypothetical protein